MKEFIQLTMKCNGKPTLISVEDISSIDQWDKYTIVTMNDETSNRLVLETVEEISKVFKQFWREE